MKKLFSFFAALTLSVGLWAANSVITFTSTGKLYPGDKHELMKDNSKWEAFKAQFPEFAGYNSYMDFEMMMEHGGGELSFFNPNAFLDANGQVLNYTYNYDESTHAGTITFDGELVTMYGNDNTGVCAFYECTALTSITLPEGLTSIGESSFRFCSSLASVTFPKSLTTIASVAFAECTSLTSITIPANVTEIDYGAFMDCSGLTDFYVDWTTTLPTIEGNLFLDASIGTATLHVPVGSLALYQNADQWKNFGTFVEYVSPAIKHAAIAAVNAEIADTDNDNVKAIATDAATAINAATTIAEINALKSLAIAAIASAKAAYTAGETAGDAAGYQRAQDELPTEGTTGPAITITKGDKTVTFYNTDKVEYSIVDAD